MEFQRFEVERQLEEVEYIITEDNSFYRVTEDLDEDATEVDLRPIVWAARQYLETTPPTAKEALANFEAVAEFFYRAPFSVTDIGVDLGTIRMALNEYAKLKGEI